MKSARMLVALLWGLLSLVNGWGQTMGSLPLLVLKPFNDVSSEAKELGLGETLRTMFYTSLDGGLIFRIPTPDSVRDFSLESLKRNLGPQARQTHFLGAGFASKVAGIIQLDLQIYDIYTGTLVYSTYFQTDKLTALRANVEQTVNEAEAAIFRDTLSELAIKTTPGNSQVMLDNRFVGLSDKSGDLKLDKVFPGSYVMRVLNTGYMEYQDNVVIKPRAATNVTATLALEPGSLMIDSVPPHAVINLDGRKVGETPYRIGKIEPGEHRIRLELADYKPWESKWTIASREESQIKATMEISPGSLRLTTNPETANVIYNGKDMGKTPLSLYNLKPGTYTLEINYPKYETQTISAVINPNKETEYKAELAKKKGLVSVLSTPDGADIYLSNPALGIPKTLLGQTPLKLYPLELGDYQLVLEKSGYYPVNKNLWVNTGSEKVVLVESELKHIPGSIRVTTKPEQAEIFLNGAFRGITPLEIMDVEPGTYTVMVKTAYNAKDMTVQVEPNKVAEVDLALTKPSTVFIPGIVVTAISLLSFLLVMGQ